jgi:catechol 2,3-dioxygenase-like lactoylglutathione lyase family enzyme
MAIVRTVPNFHSDSPEKSRSFYHDFLGFKIGMDMDWIITFVSNENPKAQVSIISEDPLSHIHPDCSIEVLDVNELHENAKNLGLKILYPLTDEPWGVRRFFVEDPNGKVINLMQHVGT